MSGEIARDVVGDYQYGFHDPENATIVLTRACLSR